MIALKELDEEQTTLLDIIYSVIKGWGSEDPTDD
jgi:hypothetical protein